MQPEQRTATPQYWLMISDVPAGPFDVPGIHAKLVAGTVTWQTLACQVGGSTWLPLVKLPGFGPNKGSTSEGVQVPIPTPSERADRERTPQLPEVTRPREVGELAWILVGYICIMASLLIFPPLFGVAGVGIGIRNKNKGYIEHGNIQIGLSIACAIVSMIFWGSFFSQRDF
jgi:hypothetical protein